MHSSQRAVCERFGASFLASDPSLKLGLSRDARSGVWPLHGLRHPIEGGTCGWYIWSGSSDFPADADFFEPMHVAHLEALLPEVLPYLGLPPGWRFLVAPGHVDVWRDDDLLYT